MRAVVFAYHDVGCRGLDVLARLGVDIALVYTHEDDPAEDTWFGSVRATCARLGVHTAVGADPNAPHEVERIRALAPDALFSFYYRDMLRRPVLDTAKHGGFNLHGSLLPRYRGRAPVNWQILHGEREGGVTLHHMVERADAGDIVDQEAFVIGPDDTPTAVYARLVEVGARVLERSAPDCLRGEARRVLQLESKATKFGRRRPDDGRIDFRHSADDVRNLVRAVTRPYPGAFAFAGERRVAVWWAEHAGRSPHERDAPGTVRRVGADALVACADGRSLRLVDVEVDGVEPGAVSEFLRDGLVLTGQPRGGR